LAEEVSVFGGIGGEAVEFAVNGFRIMHELVGSGGEQPHGGELGEDG